MDSTRIIQLIQNQIDSGNRTAITSEKMSKCRSLLDSALRRIDKVTSCSEITVDLRNAVSESIVNFCELANIPIPPIKIVGDRVGSGSASVSGTLVGGDFYLDLPYVTLRDWNLDFKTIDRKKAILDIDDAIGHELQHFVIELSDPVKSRNTFDANEFGIGSKEYKADPGENEADLVGKLFSKLRSSLRE